MSFIAYSNFMSKAERTALLKMRCISWIDQNEIGKNIAKNVSKNFVKFIHLKDKKATFFLKQRI